MSTRYLLNQTDLVVLAAIGQILRRLAVSSSISPAQLVSIAKVLHVLCRLPSATEGVCVTLEISCRVNQEGCSSSSSWQFSVGADWLTLSCGGSEYTEGVGSDSFTTMAWSAQPGARTDYDGSWDHAWMQRDEYSDPAVNGEDFRDCSISIDDDDNPLLTENGGSDGEDDEDEADTGAGIELYRRGEKIDLTRDEWEAALRTFQEMGWEPEVAFERYLMTPTFIKHDEGEAMKEAGAQLWAMFDKNPALTLSLDLDVDLFVRLVRFVGDGAFMVGKPGAFESATLNDF